MSRNGQSIQVAVAPGGGPRAQAPSRGGEGAGASVAPRAQTPLIDIHEGPNGLILEADLPGVVESGVTIQLEDNVLNLSAEVAVAVPNARILHQEFHAPGRFERSFILSDEVDRAGITAELSNGILRLVLPRAERLKTRRIEVKGS